MSVSKAIATPPKPAASSKDLVFMDSLLWKMVGT
jgi:hypothetical protein